MTMIALPERTRAVDSDRNGWLVERRRCWVAVPYAQANDIRAYKTLKNALTQGAKYGGQPYVLELDPNYLPVVHEPYRTPDGMMRLRWLARVAQRIRSDSAVTFELAEHEMREWGVLADKLSR
jgi:hypothetical protein